MFEDGDLLRRAIFGDGEVIFGQPLDGVSLLVFYGDGLDDQAHGGGHGVGVAAAAGLLIAANDLGACACGERR